MADRMDLKQEAQALGMQMNGLIDEYTGFVLLLYRRRVDGVEVRGYESYE